MRIVEGVRLKVRFDRLRLVVSGGAPAGQATPAAGYARLARDLGIPADSLVLLPDALDTGDEAHNIAATRDGTLSFWPHRRITCVVPCASCNAPALIRCLRRPASLSVEGRLSWSSFVPRSVGLRRTEHALHEYFGLPALAFGVE